MLAATVLKNINLLLSYLNVNHPLENEFLSHYAGNLEAITAYCDDFFACRCAALLDDIAQQRP